MEPRGLAHSRAVKFLSDMQAEVATFARESHDALGRGVVMVSIPNVTVPALVKTSLEYQALADVIRQASTVEGETRRQVDGLIHMLETYDPGTQVVVIVAPEGEGSITATVRLDKPIIVDGPDTIH